MQCYTYLLYLDVAHSRSSVEPPNTWYAMRLRDCEQIRHAQLEGHSAGPDEVVMFMTCRRNVNMLLQYGQTPYINCFLLHFSIH